MREFSSRRLNNQNPRFWHPLELGAIISRAPPMTTNSEEPPSKFDRMLKWLSDDPDEAAKKHETIRKRIIEILASRGCHEADYWADVVIDRVVSRIEKLENGYVGNPAHYFHGVSKKVFLEYLKKRNLPDPPPKPTPPENLELEHACLEHCLKQLPPDDEFLMREYYAKEGREKIDNRNKVAEKLGIGLNAARIRAHRGRIVLKRCILECLERDTS